MRVQTDSPQAVRFLAPPDGRLTTAMLAVFRRDGFLILEDFITPSACYSLQKRAQALVAEFDLEGNRTIFSTISKAHESTDYFLKSGDKIRFFLEEGSCDAAGHLLRSKALSINKIGHALHDLDPVFERFSRTAQLARLAVDLGIQQPLLLQSMYIFKQPTIGGEVTCHQDASYLYTEPLSCLGFWFALEDATSENGCMYALPGRYPLKQRLRRTPNGLEMQTLDSTPWPDGALLSLAAKQGTLIVLDGLLPHLSDVNRSPYSRHAYTLHVIDGCCHYPPDNWLQRSSDMPLRGFDA